MARRDTSHPRPRWLRDAIVRDNLALLQRAPDATAQKLLKMASSPYTYFRGTAALFWRDALGPGPHHATTSHSSPHAHLLVGDPHPENIGTYLGGDGNIHIEFNDFDASTRGPYHLDVRRLALGYVILAKSSHTLEDAAERIAEAVTCGYVDELVSQSNGHPPTSFTFARGEDTSHAGVILSELIGRAERDGEARQELDDYAPIYDYSRSMFYGVLTPPEVEGVARRETTTITDSERELVDALMLDYNDSIVSSNAMSPRALRIKGVSRRLGAGVSSYPVRRYYVLTKGPTLELADDLLLEFKETLNPPPITHGVHEPTRYMHDAQRVVTHQRTLQTNPDQDLWLGYAQHDGACFRVRHRTKYQKGVDVTRITQAIDDEDYGIKAVLEIARKSGHLLAATHARAPLVDGTASLPSLRDALGDDPEGFVTETTSAASTYAVQTLADYHTFRTLIDQREFTLSP